MSTCPLSRITAVERKVIVDDENEFPLSLSFICCAHYKRILQMVEMSAEDWSSAPLLEGRKISKVE